MSKKSVRYKSIDILRGISISWMIIGHLLEWWMDPAFYESFTILIHQPGEPFGASCFLLVSGMSIVLSYRGSLAKAAKSQTYTTQMARNEYMFRAFLILGVALGYNTFVAISFNNLAGIWTWFILQTIAISIIIAYPLLKLTKYARIIIGLGIWIANYFILDFLAPFDGEMSFFGILYFILYNKLSLVTILYFFPFYLFGTVIGEIYWEASSITEDEVRKAYLKKHLLIPGLIIGSIALFISVIIMFPEFNTRRTLAWFIYSVGFHAMLLSIVLILTDLEFIKTKKKYTFLYYFSYYSLTIYLLHNVLYFIFEYQLNPYTIFLCIIPTYILMWYLLRLAYFKLGKKFSIKVQLSVLAFNWAKKLENKKRPIPAPVSE